MKPTQIRDLLANIKDTFVSFFSILMFAALGVGVFLGISWASPALENAADKMFNDGVLHNFQIQYPYGLTDDDLKELESLDEVSEVEAERQSFQTMLIDNTRYTVKVQSLSEKMDVPIIVEGTLPEHSDEIAIHDVSAEKLGISIGDTIEFERDAVMDGDDEENESGMAYLLRRTFKVTALMKSADYVANSSATYGYSNSPSGEVDCLAWVVDRVFDASSFQDGYPIVNIRYNALDGKNTFSDDYKNASAEAEKPIKELGDRLATDRYNDLHGNAQKEIDDGRAKIEEAEKEIENGEKEIEEGEKKLEEGKAELESKKASAQAELDSAYDQLIAAEAELASAEAQLDDGYAKVNDGRAQINEADYMIAVAEAEVDDAEDYKAKRDAELEDGTITEKQYNDLLDARGAQANDQLEPLASEYGVTIPAITHNNYDTAIYAARIALANSEEIPVTVEGEEMTLGEARIRLAQAESELADAEATYNAAVDEINYNWGLYYDGQATLESEVASAEAEIADGEAKIEEAKKQVEDGKAEVALYKPALDEAQAALDEMTKFDWTVLPRAYNSGAVEVTTFSNVTNNLSISMALLFIVVGLLVSYFAVSRIVHEQVTQIGTKKALGFRQGEITKSFLWYSGLAVTAGAIIGAIVGFFLVEGIIGGVLGDMFAFGTYPAYFGWGLFLLMTAIELVLVLGATYLACRKILKQHAVDLLRGDAPPAGKTHFYEKWGVWDKLPLFIQTIVNNCVNDKRRVLSTIVGVAGCTALIVTALTLNDDVMKSYDRHYENVYGFNAITYSAYDPPEAIHDLEDALTDTGADNVEVFMKRYLLIQPNGESGAMRVVVPDEEESFNRLYHVNITDGTDLDLSAEGAWVSQAYAEHLKAKVGDTIVIDGGDGMQHEIKILGFYEFWLTYNEMVMGKDYFESEFNTTFESNAVLSKTGETSVADAKSSISGIEGFDSMVDDAALQYENFEMFSAVSSAVVIIYIILAVLMAIVVLLNLNVMFITEKKRELIVLMINGFSVKDARHYISYDNIVLTALGIIVGLILGCLMGSLTVASIEPITGTFVKSADLVAIITGILGSTILAIIMSMIALRRVNKFDLTDINRF